MSHQDLPKRWDDFTSQAQQWWGRLTPSDCSEINGNRDRLAAKLESAYSISRSEANRHIDEFTAKLRPAVSSGDVRPIGQDPRVKGPSPLAERFANARTPSQIASTAQAPSPQQVAQARDTRGSSTDPNRSTPQPGSTLPGKRNPSDPIIGSSKPDPSKQLNRSPSDASRLTPPLGSRLPDTRIPSDPSPASPRQGAKASIQSESPGQQMEAEDGDSAADGRGRDSSKPIGGSSKRSST